jgi:hypothetical protein
MVGVSVALESKKISEASKRDGSALKSLTVLTAIFFPATYIAVRPLLPPPLLTSSPGLIPNPPTLDALFPPNLRQHALLGILDHRRPADVDDLRIVGVLDGLSAAPDCAGDDSERS